jgi:dipeptidyl aminopeptidase/acylaminoacyl peptidase
MNSSARRQPLHALRASGTIAAVASLAISLGALAQVVPSVSSDIEHLLEAEPLPPVVVDPTGRYAVLVHERQLLPMGRLAEPAIELAGHMINPLTGAAHAPLDYYGLTLIDLGSREQIPLVLPRDAVFGYPKWAPDGSRFAFTLTRSRGTELWIGEPGEARARLLASAIDGARGSPCVWTADSRRLLCRFVAFRDNRRVFDAIADRLAGEALPGEPTILSEGQTKRLLETQLGLVDSVSSQRYSIGAPAAFESVVPAPGQAFLLVTRIAEPYPQVTGLNVAERVVEIWDRFGRLVRRLPTRARAVEWRASKPATLTWVEQRDDADHIMVLAPPYSGSPLEAFELPNRFSGLRWIGDSSAALVSDYDSSRRRTDLWYVDFDATDSAPRLVTGYSSDSARLPLMTTDSRGFATLRAYGNGFYLRGEELDGPRRRPFLEHVALDTGTRRRVWQAGEEGFEGLVEILSPDAQLLLTRRETSTAPPNYFVSASTRPVHWPLTHFEHPAPPLAAAHHVRLEYRRDDGVDLAASLYLPPGYQRGSPLPLVLWAYPRQISAGDAAKIIGAEGTFMTFARAFRLFFLLRGYAVLDDVSMPIIGSEGEANDTFVEQVVANAAAAIDAAESTGLIDAKRVGVAGHSYGAFMVANLLAHSRLFAAGVAMSGAYNRTLTPFGFQTERRTLWQATETYLAMSPLLYSDNIEAPLLLVHGLKDDNAGTSPQQSLQFYQAIRGNGGDVELLLLPWEGHSYRGRESVLKTAAQMLRWFDDHLKEPAVEE